MYGCESWTVKKAECRRIDAFKLWCWRRLSRIPWTTRRSNQSILKEISPGISLEGMMLKLKLQSFGHLMRRGDSLEKTLKLGGIGGRRKRERLRMRWLDGIWVNCGSWWWTGRPGVLRFMGSQSQTRLSDWTELNWNSILKSRDITLPTKVHLVKAMVFPVVMHGCESWTIKKFECQRINAFELWCWRRLSRVPWTARRSNSQF